MPPGFITKAKAGKLYPCRTCQRTPVENQEIYMQNKGTEQAPQWIACIDQACFESQGGDKGVVKKTGYTKKERTCEQKMTDCVSMLEACWAISKKKADEIMPFEEPKANDTMDSAGIKNREIARQRMILAQCLYKGVVMEWARG